MHDSGKNDQTARWESETHQQSVREQLENFIKLADGWQDPLILISAVNVA